MMPHKTFSSQSEDTCRNQEEVLPFLDFAFQYFNESPNFFYIGQAYDYKLECFLHIRIVYNYCCNLQGCNLQGCNLLCVKVPVSAHIFPSSDWPIL